MEIKRAQQILAEKICQSTEWLDKLNESEPGHYGIEDWEVVLFPEDIWVDMQAKKFNFKNAKFNFDLAMGESKDPFSDSFSKIAIGNGSFEIKSDVLTIEEIEVDFDLDLYGDDE